MLTTEFPTVVRTFIAKLRTRRRRQQSWDLRATGPVGESSATTAEVMDSVVQDMAGLELSTTATAMDGIVQATAVSESHVFGDKDFGFEFGLSAINRAWPGPSYDGEARILPASADTMRQTKRKSRQKTPKRRLSQEDRSGVPRYGRSREAMQIDAIATVERPCSTQVSPQPEYRGEPSPKHPPTHLLTLPGELRNQIYRILCPTGESIQAQFRTVINPRKGRSDKAHAVRRLPLEPALAMVCQQLHREVLSLFYGENKFIFHKRDVPWIHFAQHTPFPMTHEKSIAAWSPRLGFASALRHVELHFKVKHTTHRAFCIQYKLSKSADGVIRLTNNADADAYCACGENQALLQIRTEVEKDGSGTQDLLSLAARLSAVRRNLIEINPETFAVFPHAIYRPRSSHCAQCGWEYLREVASGL